MSGWRRDGVFLCLLPVFWWPAVAGCALVRPRAVGALLLVVLLSPVVLGVRELYVAWWAGRALRSPLPWRPCRVAGYRSALGAPVVLLGEGGGVVTPGLLGRRVLPTRPWPPGSAGDGVVWLAGGGGEPGGVGACGALRGARCLVWAPGARRLGRGRLGPGTGGRSGRAGSTARAG
ncbi:hypothetical protein ABT084_03710 [Streptomyces sp. NPDC002138]|uniref:hypothetical protein n=1 Tax=Streptomyces sp. NPDC002138 TaxID=3154410 RepID=UPI00332E63B1